MREKDADKRKEEHSDELHLLAELMTQKPRKDGSVDESSLESRRRAITYGRARGNV